MTISWTVSIFPIGDQHWLTVSRCVTAFFSSVCYSVLLKTFSPRNNLPSAKKVQIRSFFWFLFPRIQFKYRKMRTRKNSVFGHVLHSVVYLHRNDLAECTIVNLYSSITNHLTDWLLQWCVGCDRTALEKETALFKEYENEIIQTKHTFCFASFSFCPSLEKCYYMCPFF